MGSKEDLQRETEAARAGQWVHAERGDPGEPWPPRTAGSIRAASAIPAASSRKTRSAEVKRAVPETRCLVASSARAVVSPSPGSRTKSPANLARGGRTLGSIAAAARATRRADKRWPSRFKGVKRSSKVREPLEIRALRWLHAKKDGPAGLRLVKAREEHRRRGKEGGLEAEAAAQPHERVLESMCRNPPLVERAPELDDEPRPIGLMGGDAGGDRAARAKLSPFI